MILSLCIYKKDNNKYLDRFIYEIRDPERELPMHDLGRGVFQRTWRDEARVCPRVLKLVNLACAVYPSDLPLLIDVIHSLLRSTEVAVIIWRSVFASQQPPSREMVYKSGITFTMATLI